MIKVKEIFKQISDKLSRTVRYSPDQLERQIILSKLDALADHIDDMSEKMLNGLSGVSIKIADLEEKPNKVKKNVKLSKQN
jgi:hypothetical protein